MGDNGIKRIQRVSGRFCRFFMALMFLIPLLNVLYWVSFNDLPAELTADLPALASQPLSPFFLALALAVSLIPISVALYGIMILKRLFSLYENAVVFSVENVRCFRRLGYTLIAWVIASMVFTMLISIIISAGNPPGERVMVAQFGFSDLFALISGAIVVLISWVMEEGCRLENEQAYTV
ncbi:MAG: DUF2975 domain-containing protein [Gammaproteobacteria bacterium]|nr:DUF2975 domain-containing protein [Gammaproteobacteria bacterium]MCF6362374.1 DUF2975 domain-containing protein [Gammaproteobacteria bacterium]